MLGKRKLRLTDPKCIAPTALVDGVTVTPPGWMWSLAFATKGIGWAVETCLSNNWQDGVREWDSKAGKSQEQIEEMIRKIEVKLEMHRRRLGLKKPDPPKPKRTLRLE